MKRTMPWSEPVDVISSDESSSSDSDVDVDYGLDGQQSSNDTTTDQPTVEITSEGIHIAIQDLNFASSDECFLNLDH